MAMYDPAHPGELIRDTIEGLREETGKSLTIEESQKGLNDHSQNAVGHY